VHFVGLYYTVPFSVILQPAFLSFYLSRFQIRHLCAFFSLPKVTNFRAARLANFITRVIFGVVIAQRIVVITCRRFGTNDRFHF